jgi:hypothetical protein
LRKILTLFLVLVMVLCFLACEEGKEEEAQLPSAQEAEKTTDLTSAQEVLNGVLGSRDDIKTYQFDMDMTMDMSAERGEEAYNMNMNMSYTGAADFVNRKMRADMTMNMYMPMLGEDEMTMDMEMYLVNDMMYMMMEVPEMGPQWMKSDMPMGYWEKMDFAGSQVDLLEAAQFELMGTESVGGIDCYVLRVTPDVERLWQWYLGQQQLSEGGGPEIEPGMIADIFRSFSVKQWVAKDTYFMTKAEIDMTLEITPEAMGQPGESGILTMDITSNVRAYDYNQPVSIVLPPEAEAAIETPAG